MKIIKMFSLGVLLILSSCSYCDFMKEQNSKEFFGVLYEKKIFEWDRGKKVLKIFSNSDIVNYYFPTNYDYHDFWKEINVGDSIYKGPNSKEFKVFRSGVLIRKQELDFSCED